MEQPVSSGILCSCETEIRVTFWSHAAHRAGTPSLPGPVPGQRVSILTQPLQPAVAGAFTGRAAPFNAATPFRRVG
ncbi:hypothetical protein, partial [Pantoea dispersa]|uniref:hypothetical protein n=1 Tax=Pantoea dispersa TaxID=59814 RepID=UPI001BACEA36